MTIIHPTFCDPRTCTPVGPDDTDHRSTPTSWQVTADDVVVSAGLSRLDNAGKFPSIGPVRVVLSLEHLELCRTVEVDLSPADARMLAAVLDVEADRAGAATDRAGVR